MSNIIDGTEEQGTEIEKENKDLEVLVAHRVLIDLHGTKLHEAMSMAGSWAHRVINSEEMMCIGLIHGRGVHSGDIHEFDEFDEFDENDPSIVILTIFPFTPSGPLACELL